MALLTAEFLRTDHHSPLGIQGKTTYNSKSFVFSKEISCLAIKQNEIERRE